MTDAEMAAGRLGCVGGNGGEGGGASNMSDEPCCYWCKFWLLRDYDENGKCRRNAPEPMTYLTHGDCHEVDMQVVWPFTHWEEWCGEFEPHATRRLFDPDLGPGSSDILEQKEGA